MKLFWNRRRTMHILPTQRNIQYKPCQTRDLLYRISARSETKDTSPVRCSVEAISDALNATKETTYNRKLELEQIWNCTYIYIYICVRRFYTYWNTLFIASLQMNYLMQSPLNRIFYRFGNVAIYYARM